MTSLLRVGGDASAKGARNGDQNRLADVRSVNQRCCAVYIDLFRWASVEPWSHQTTPGRKGPWK
jgi:hypothetical protein